jgi:hypothetical protein
LKLILNSTRTKSNRVPDFSTLFVWVGSVPEEKLQIPSGAAGEAIFAPDGNHLKGPRTSHQREESVDIFLGKSVPYSLQTHMDGAPPRLLQCPEICAGQS